MSEAVAKRPRSHPKKDNDSSMGKLTVTLGAICAVCALVLGGVYSLTADQIKNLAQNQIVYTWVFEDGRGDPIQMTVMQYFERYVYNRDYTQAPEIGVDRIMTGGNALENLAEAYPGCRFVDFSFPSADPVNDGMDWSSLKLVFQPAETRWYLVGVVHGEWTI